MFTTVVKIWEHLVWFWSTTSASFSIDNDKTVHRVSLITRAAIIDKITKPIETSFWYQLVLVTMIKVVLRAVVNLVQATRSKKKPFNGHKNYMRLLKNASPGKIDPVRHWTRISNPKYTSDATRQIRSQKIQ